ncbi:MAG: DUF4398 domain-containing protein [Polyangiales bacterium]
MRFLNFAVAAIAVVTAIPLGACGSFPKPDARISSSEGAIRGAQEAGAQGVPQANLHLKLAQEERDKAMGLIKDEENEKAEYLLMRAEADAELANSLAREAAAKAETAKTAEQVELLKKKAASQ